MNIVLIVIDTLRYDHVAANGNEWIETPNMDRLAAQSWCFDRAFTASYATIPHRTDVQTGRCGGPFHKWQPLPFDVPTLPRALAQSGYCTQLIHDTPHLVNGGHNFDWPFHAWTFVRGAEVDRPWIDAEAQWMPNWALDPLFDCLGEGASLDRLDWRLATYASANRKRKKNEDWNCARLFRTACRFLEDNSSRDNFFLWIDCFDPHEPWDAPPEFVLKYDKTPGYDGRIDPRVFWRANHKELPDAAQKRVKAQYAAKVSWMDHCLGKFLDALETCSLAGNTAVVFTADHGTNLRERGRFYKGYPLQEQTAHVPFMIRVPGAGSGRSDMLVQPQDLFATIAAIAGAECPAHLDSHNVLAPARAGKDGPRQIVLAGTAASPKWASDQILFTAFDRRWCLEVAARPEDSRLTRMGTLECVERDHADAVEAMHAAALDELERREIDPTLMAWLRKGGGDGFPTVCRFYDGWPGPAGYRAYFGRLYGHERP